MPEENIQTLEPEIEHEDKQNFPEQEKPIESNRSGWNDVWKERARYWREFRSIPMVKEEHEQFS